MKAGDTEPAWTIERRRASRSTAAGTEGTPFRLREPAIVFVFAAAVRWCGLDRIVERRSGFKDNLEGL